MTALARRIAVKRVIDTVLVVLSAPLTIPLALGTALAVRMKLGKPVLFKQVRIGLEEQSFTLLKFRSMLPEEDKNGNLLKPADRMTSFGRTLRKTSLDELPQLLNILRGDMSLVGPRPLLPEYLPYYRRAERARHSVRPGITGPSQVGGRNILTWDARLACDAEYGRNGTLADDLLILLRTVRKVVRSEGVNADLPATGIFLYDERAEEMRSLALRDLHANDLACRVKWFNDPRMTPTMVFPDPITLEGTKSWFASVEKNPQRKDLVMVDQTSGRVLGFIGYRPFDNPLIPEIYIAVDPDRHGQGLGTEMLRLLLEEMKESRGLDGAVAEMYRSNPGVIRSFEKCGFVEIDPPSDPLRMRMGLVWRV